MDAQSNGDAPANPIQGQPFHDPRGGVRDPFGGYGWMVEPNSGTTKRELFAAMAMQGIVASLQPHTPPQDLGEKVANAAVLMADALLAELARGGDK